MLIKHDIVDYIFDDQILSDKQIYQLFHT